MKKALLTAALALAAAFSHCQTAVGHWRDCLDHSLVHCVAPAGERVYAAVRGGVFCYDLGDLTLSRLNKTTGLSDAGVATIAYDPQTSCLAVAYNNSNLDLVINGNVYNLSDIKRSEISGDKSIYRIRYRNGMAYLATGFGIVVVDVARREIKETWYIGNGGSYTAVRDMTVAGDSLYAATDEGLKRIALADPHPSISDRWTTDPRMAGVSVTMLDQLDGHLLAGGYTFDPEQISLYRLDNSGFHRWDSGEVRSMRAGGGCVTVARESSVVRYGGNPLQRLDSLSDYPWGSLKCFDAVTTGDGTLWVGHEWAGLIRITASEYDFHKPDGPFSGDNNYRLYPYNYRMMLCPGGHTPTYANSYLDPNLLTAVGRQWYTLDKGNGMLDGTADLLDVAINPMDTTELAAALWGSGVASIRDNKVQALYNNANTGGALVPYVIGDYSTLRTGDVEFDGAGNLWVLISESPSALARRGTDGTWSKFDTRALASKPELDKLVWDSVNNYLWFCGRDNIIYVHDGESRLAKVNPNSGSKLQTDAVTALVQDRNGNLWVGTNKGIKVIYDGYRAFADGGTGETSPVSCSNITITNGEFYEYLMAYESITAIAVDGANRKWVGTAAGGLYLISANGLDQLQHFTAENSPLFSNKIVCLGINQRTGEVYVGTDRGLQVYRSTATYAVSTPLDNVYAFPNPVRPDYDGPIAIKGFTRDAYVHITDASGHTVFSTQALGGQAIWNGRTADG